MTSTEAHRLTITASDGVRLAATCTGRPDSPATLVYVHGLLCDRQYWTPVVERVDDCLRGGITQITYDQRGHGESGRPHRTAHTTVRRLADDLDAVLAITSGSVLVVAHCAGALTVGAYAAQYRRRAAALSGLIVFNGGGEFPEFPSLPTTFRRLPQRVARLRRGCLDGVAAVAAAMLEHQFRRAGRKSRAQLTIGDRATDPRVSADILESYRNYTITEDVAAGLRSVPSWVYAGGRDKVVPATQSARLADKLWSDLEVIPDAGHSLPHTDPDYAVTAILAALDVAYRADRDDPSVEIDDWIEDVS
ncbi:alpha/beta fold hydrolase [Nocardia sp. NPDC003482]